MGANGEEANKAFLNHMVPELSSGKIHGGYSRLTKPLRIQAPSMLKLI